MAATGKERDKKGVVVMQDRQTDIRAVGRYCNVDTTNKRINMGIYYCLFIQCTVTEYDVR